MDHGQRLAFWYDLDQGLFADDIPFYLGLARRTDGPILEMGCGTGRLVLALAQAGHRVTGIEREPAMLARAVDKLRAAGRPAASRATLLQGDIRQLDIADRFGLAILAVNTFMSLDGPAEQSQVLERAGQHLLPGGMLVLDLFHPDPQTLASADGTLQLEKALHDPQTGRHAFKFVARQLDAARQELTATFIYDEHDAAGQVTRTAGVFRLRYLHRVELEHMLAAAGYAVEAVYGGYDLEPYDEDAERLLVLARRETI